MSNPQPILAGEKRLLSASSTSTAFLPRSCLFAFKAGGKSSRMVCCCASRLESVIPSPGKRCLSLHRRTLDAFGVPTAFEHRQVVGASKLIMMRLRQDPGDFIRFGASCGFLESLHPGKLTWNLKITYLKRNVILQTFTIVFHVDFQGCAVSV